MFQSQKINLMSFDCSNTKILFLFYFLSLFVHQLLNIDKIRKNKLFINNIKKVRQESLIWVKLKIIQFKYPLKGFRKLSYIKFDEQFII